MVLIFYLHPGGDWLLTPADFSGDVELGHLKDVQLKKLGKKYL